MSHLLGSSCLALALLTPSAVSQHRDVGLQLGQPALLAGSMCGPFACAPLQATVQGGVAAHASVYSAPAFPFALLVSASASRCLPIPGIAHGLVLDDPLFVLIAGPSNPPIAALCPAQQQVFMGGFGIRFTVPPVAGASFALQAFGFAGNDVESAVPAFSRAIHVTIQ